MKITITQYYTSETKKRPAVRAGHITKQSELDKTIKFINKMLKNPSVGSIQLNLVKEVK